MWGINVQHIGILYPSHYAREQVLQALCSAFMPVFSSEYICRIQACVGNSTNFSRVEGGLIWFQFLQESEDGIELVSLTTQMFKCRSYSVIVQVAL